MTYVASNGVAALAPRLYVSSGEAASINHKRTSESRSQWWPCLSLTMSKANVPCLFREPHVETGFRQMHQPWSYYLFSIFQVHNECMNVWTHLIALVVIIHRWWVFSQQLDMIHDPYMWPLGAEFCSLFLLFSFSSGAHCFSSKSELIHYTCFIVDYAGIGLHGLGSTIGHYWYSMHPDINGAFPHRFAAPVGVVLSSLVCCCCSVAKVYYSRPYPFTRRLWQITSCLAIYIWLIFPVGYQLYLFLFQSYWEPSLADHAQHMFWFLLGGFFFSSDIPQRLYPGTFDFVGHSHQLFHVCIMMTSLKQLDAVYQDIVSDHEELYSSQPPTFLGTYGAVLLGLVINLALVGLFRQMAWYKITREAQKKKEQ